MDIMHQPLGVSKVLVLASIQIAPRDSLVHSGESGGLGSLLYYHCYESVGITLLCPLDETCRSDF